MALNTKISDATANASADAACALANSGKLRIYSGAQPVDANTAIGAQVLLAELVMDSTAFGAASAGVATANTITGEDDAPATGVASWFRMFKSDGTTALWDGSVGTSGCDLNLPTTSIAEHDTVDVTGYVYGQPEA